MKVPFTGGCACGAVRYECSAQPAFSWICHCRDCQRASGSAFCPVLYVEKTALTITGERKYHDVQAESGNLVSRGFCPQCDSPVFIQAELVPSLQGVWAASQSVSALGAGVVRKRASMGLSLSASSANCKSADRASDARDPGSSGLKQTRRDRLP